jgi:hypothetical protein
MERRSFENLELDDSLGTGLLNKAVLIKFNILI